MQRNNLVISTIYLSILLMCGSTVLADHPSVGLSTGRASPITTVGAGTLENGQWSFGVKVELNDNNSISNKRLIANAEVHQGLAPDELRTAFQFISLATNAVFWIELGILSAYFYNKFSERVESTAANAALSQQAKQQVKTNSLSVR